MSIQDIVLAGTPQLRQKAKRLNAQWFNTAQAHQLIDTLFATMKAKNGVGLAAPQIGVSHTLFVYGFETNPRYPNQDPVPLTVMINPSVVTASQEKNMHFEGCLSLPTIRGNVPRHDWIEIDYQDVKGHTHHKRATGFEARIIQHELDHLSGLLFPDKMDDMKTLGITTALKEAGVIP